MKNFKYNGTALNISTAILYEHGFLNENNINPRAMESLFNDEIEDMKYTTAVLMNLIDDAFYSTDYSVVDLGKKLMQTRNALLKDIAQVGLYVLQHGEDEKHIVSGIKKLYSTTKEQAIPYGNEDSSVLYISTEYETKADDGDTIRIDARTSLSISKEYPNSEYITLLSTENSYNIGKENDIPDELRKAKAAAHFEQFCRDLITKCDDISKFIPGSCAFEMDDASPLRCIEYYQFRASDDVSTYTEYIDVIGNAVIPSTDHIEMTRILNALLSDDSTEVDNEMFNLQLMGFSNWDILGFMVYGNTPDLSITQDQRDGSSDNFVVNYWSIISSEFKW